MTVLNKKHLRVLAAGLLLSAVTQLGCKDGQTIISGFVIAQAAFTADAVNVPDHFVTLETASSEAGTIFMDVVLNDITDPVSGIALKMSYPAEFSRFVGCTNGALLPSGTCFATETGVGSGEVFIARSGTGNFNPVTGAQSIVRLEFLVFTQGSGRIVFEGQNLGGGDTSAVLDDNGDPIFMRWFSGTLMGVDP